MICTPYCNKTLMLYLGNKFHVKYDSIKTQREKDFCPEVYIILFFFWSYQRNFLFIYEYIRSFKNQNIKLLITTRSESDPSHLIQTYILGCIISVFIVFALDKVQVHIDRFIKIWYIFEFFPDTD